MTIQYGGKTTIAASSKLLVCALAGIIAGLATWGLGAHRLALLMGWEVAAALFLGWTAYTVAHVSPELTAAYASREDPSRTGTDVTMLFACGFSLLALLLVLTGGDSNGKVHIGEVALGVLSVVLSWLVVHTVFMLKYAEQYYTDPVGGVEFDGVKNPSYADFAYLAFTIGMTFQVSDTGFKNKKFRALALRHALLSYIFGTIIVATTVNLVAGLSK